MKFFQNTRAKSVIVKKCTEFEIESLLTVITMSIKIAKTPLVEEITLVELGTTVDFGGGAFVINRELQTPTHIKSRNHSLEKIVT